MPRLVGSTFIFKRAFEGSNDVGPLPDRNSSRLVNVSLSGLADGPEIEASSISDLEKFVTCHSSKLIALAASPGLPPMEELAFQFSANPWSGLD